MSGCHVHYFTEKLIATGSCHHFLHSSLTKIRQRVPGSVDLEIFQLVIKAAQDKGLLKGKTVAVDATTLEANAAMTAIVLRKTGEDWKEYLRRLYQAEHGEDEDDLIPVKRHKREDEWEEWDF